jgi:rod shape-determining protein MreC
VLFAVCGAFSLLFAGILPGNVRESFAAGLRRTVVAPLVSLQRRAELSRSAFLTHDAITAQRDSVAMRSLGVAEIESENRHLRALLGLGAKLQWGFVAAEAMHAEDTHARTPSEDYTLTLTAGSRAGVRPFSPVVAPGGLVGMVRSVDPTMSLAITWADPDFRVSAMTADGSAFGIVQAHLGTGPERYLLELRGVPFRNTLTPGVLVVSSGWGGVFPRGIPVGTVLGEVKTAEGWARTYLVRPAVPPPEISSVMILQPQRVSAGVETVWASVIAADSAARKVSAAGDSIARLAAQEEVAARRAALGTAGATDSLTAAQQAAVPKTHAESVAVATGAIVSRPTPVPARPATPRPVTPKPTDSASARRRPPADSARRTAPRLDTLIPSTIPSAQPTGGRQ